MSTSNLKIRLALGLVATALVAPQAFAAASVKSTCDDVYNSLLAAGVTTKNKDADAHKALYNALQGVLTKTQAANTTGAIDPGNNGLHNPMWATIVGRDGKVCVVAASDTATQDYTAYVTAVKKGDNISPTMKAWQMSRAISAEKANTAAALSSNTLPLSTANLYAATQPGGSLFGLLSQSVAYQVTQYKGDPKKNGIPKDPMEKGIIGGVNVFGGGLPLYGNVSAAPTSANTYLIGGLGVSGDTSCTDHAVAWAVREVLKLGTFPSSVINSGKGVNTSATASGFADNIIYDMTATGTSGMSNTASTGGWGHPKCESSNVAPTHTSF